MFELHSEKKCNSSRSQLFWEPSAERHCGDSWDSGRLVPVLHRRTHSHSNSAEPPWLLSGQRWR
jgi:hypothetical protein